ncbi:MAG TPA: phosphoglycerate kinase [Candidatus Saccharimonadales bacterium]|nr:phosphoglycerate kinase [Candidatus Saccharimonadales bacterium]
MKGVGLVRMDINVPVKNGKIDVENLRLRECAKTIETYSRNGIIPVIISHQGRKGDDDYLESMEQHASALNSLGSSVNFLYSDSLADDATKARVASLKAGDALLLKNLRSDPDEKARFESALQARDCNLVKKLSPTAKFFINDAAGNMHRPDTSQIGFKDVLPSYIGILMEKELRTLDIMRKEMDSGKKTILIFGGKKWEKLDYIYKMARRENVRVLCGGIPGQSVAYVRNKPMFNKENEDFLLKTGTLETAERLSTEFGERIVPPTDFRLDGMENVGIRGLKESGKSIMDIGDETLDSFRKEMEGADMIIYAGPVGRYEYGYNQTSKLIDKMAGKASNCYALGGNSADSIRYYGMEDRYLASGGKILTSGGSGLAFLSGSELPALEVFMQ